MVEHMTKGENSERDQLLLASRSSIILLSDRGKPYPGVKVKII